MNSADTIAEDKRNGEALASPPIRFSHGGFRTRGGDRNNRFVMAAFFEELAACRMIASGR
jgi:hypothetical protein